MSTKISEIIDLLVKMQATNTDKRIKQGVFPTYRTHAFIPYKRFDDNIYFTALIVMVLQEYLPYIHRNEKIKVEEMIAKALKSYKYYANRFGLETYNFWRQNPSLHFPNGRLLSKLSRFQLTDDTDDTALIYITENRPNNEVRWLKQEMIKHTNLYKHKIYNNFEKYQNLKAYSAWFGKNMYIEFDAAVLSNILYFVFYYKLPLNQYDYDSIKYIKSVLENGEHLSHPYYVSHYYYQSAVIMYHVARLIVKFDIPELESCKNIIIKDAQILTAKNNNLLIKIILNSTLLMLGKKTKPVKYSLIDKDIDKFCFFTASLLKPYENKFFLGKISKFQLFHIRWKSPAHSLALILENEILRSKFSAFKI